MTETTSERKSRKRRQRSERLLGPPGFSPWMRLRPCRKCGSPASVSWPNEVHHDPPEGMSRRGHWTKTSTLCPGCHTGYAKSRHRHRGGYKGFWGNLGTTREEVNAETQAEWLAFYEGLSE